MESSGRQRWTQQRRKREPTLYDQWLNEEKAKQPMTSAQGTTPVQAPSRPSAYTAAIGGSSGGTIRAVPPDDAHTDTLPERGTTSFEQAFLPLGVTTTTIVGGPAVTRGNDSTTTSPVGTSASTRLRRDRDWDVAGRGSPSSWSDANGKGLLGRSGSQSNGTHAPGAMSGREAYNTFRPRTRTLDESRRERSPNAVLARSRNRMGSVSTRSDVVSASPPNRGRDYLASVPVAISPPSAPSISSLGSPVHCPSDMAGRRSISPISSHTAECIRLSLPSASARRILHLMKTLNGRMSGNLIFRRDASSPWSQSYCFIQEETGSLMYEPRGSDGTHKILIPDLRGCKVALEEEESGHPFLALSLPHSMSEIHVKLLNQSDFDSWYAAVLCWQPLDPKGHPNIKPHPQPVAVASSPAPPEPPPRMSAARPKSVNDSRDRADSTKSNRRKSVMNSLKEAPVIKIGKMIFWDTNVTYNYSNPPILSQPSAGRPQAYLTQSYGSRRWRRISGQLRENGELKLHSDVDNTLISVVQLSQLSRCAIQRLDPSVLENDFCIAVYPQYTSSANAAVSLLRPIFLSLESRVLYEVWFVLLRAFTIPQLYGPRLPSPHDAENNHSESSDELEKMLLNTTADMFRMERSLSIRVIEAKMFPPTTGSTSYESGFSGGHGKAPQARAEQYGHYVEVLLDNETRSKTMVKFEGLNPLWGESFEFLDLPPVLTSASVVVKRRPPAHAHAREQHESKLIHEAYGFIGDESGGYSGLTFDVACGKVEIYLEELAAACEVEKWWPVVNMYSQKVGEVLIKARAEEGVILMARDYQPLSDLLHCFSNGLTLQIAQMIPGELKRLSDCMLNIFQVSGRAGDWLMALVEEEIDGIDKESPVSRLRFSRRIGSSDSNENLGTGSAHANRELLVRESYKNAAVEANLLFRGNTLLTKSLDSHMRRVGKEYLEEALGPQLREINDKDPQCEVDPNRVESQTELDRNWHRLIYYAQEVWKAILNTKQRCPIELRVIFRHVRACAEDRYGDFSRSVSYSSVSGFLFLRFFCPAVLNPKIFGLLNDEIKPKARRTLTFIAKSLQTMANMASFGTKEHWMEPMNAFLTQHRESFKGFIDEICYVPTPLSAGDKSSSASASSTHAAGVVRTETHLSYTTPMTIMRRLPPTSREGFPSLPYLIDQARAFADLVQLWLEGTSVAPASSDLSTGRPAHDITAGIKATDGDLLAFHRVCSSLHSRTQVCLNRAERAERPNSALSFRWEEIIDQLQSPTASGTGRDVAGDDSFSVVADRIASDPTIVPSTFTPDMQGLPSPLAESGNGFDEEASATRMYDTPPPSGTAAHFDLRRSLEREPAVTTSVGKSLRSSLRRAPRKVHARDTDSPDQSGSADTSNASSAVNSDAERGTDTTALPSYEVEMRQRERREAAEQRERQVERRDKDKEKERRKMKAFVPALRRKKERDRGGVVERYN